VTSGSDTGGAPPPRTDAGRNSLAAFIFIGCAVSLSLGVYAKVHTPTGRTLTTLGFPDLIQMKVWLATAALALAVVQVLTALRMYGHLGNGPSPRWVSLTHRASGVTAVVLTLPVAFHCAWSLGFATYSPRVLAHSLLGCVFYGVFVTKMLTLRSRHVPSKALPWLGGTLATILLALWLTSSLWFFTLTTTGY
jgi:heme/copper-type cytochrome/quinol oxidase subunit 4